MTERLHFHFSLSCIGEGNGTHSSVLAWRIPGTGEPGGFPSMGLHRVGHDKRLSSNSSSMTLLVVMYGCESWTIRKAECQRIDAFELLFGEDF